MPSAAEAPQPPPGRSPGWTLTAGPTQAALSKCARVGTGRVWKPLAIKAGHTQCPGRPFPPGSGGGEGKADTLLEEGLSSTGRRRPGQASGTERVCPPGVRASLRAPRVSGRLPLAIAWVLGSLLSGRLETLDNGAGARRLA